MEVDLSRMIAGYEEEVEIAATSKRAIEELLREWRDEKVWLEIASKTDREPVRCRVVGFERDFKSVTIDLDGEKLAIEPHKYTFRVLGR